MIHLDLFSGIGGFAYAIDQVFDNVEHIFCEIDPYCQQVLKKHLKGKIYGDIRTLIQELGSDTDTDSNGRTGRDKKINPTEADKQTFGNAKECFILTGGFPCQPFSQAGKRKGTNDDRYLWGEMLRVIQLTKPTWVVAENVRGLLTIEGGMVFEQVCLDLEREGYDVQAFIIPAVAVNAPHRRDRVWIVANSKGERSGRCASQECGVQERKFQQGKSEGREVRSEGEGCVSHAPDTSIEGREGYGIEGEGRHGLGNRIGENKARNKSFEKTRWNQNWIEVATELCGMDDGLPAELDGFKLSKSRHRVERLKALGNSIVPQVAVEIFKGIKREELR